MKFYRIAAAFFAITLASFLLYLPNAASAIKEVDFDVSMGIAERGRYNLMLRDGQHSIKMLNFFRNLYNKNLPSRMPYGPASKIPKIIHQIWVGHKTIPELYKKYTSTCLDKHKDWKYILWTDKDINALLKDAIPEAVELFKVYNKYNKYTGQKDVLEYLILYKYGGIFLDMDIECIQNMDEIVHKYRFFSALEPPYSARIPVMTNAILGSKPHNKLFIQALIRSWKTYQEIYNYKNSNPLKKILRFIIKGKSTKIPNIQRTMMVPLSEVLMENGADDAIVFPATYFNPVFPKAKRYQLLDEIKSLLGLYKNKNLLFKCVMPETIATQDFAD